MATTIQASLAAVSGFEAPAEEKLEQYHAIYDRNYHRIYSLAFRMTQNELAAEEVAINVFRRAFSLVASPTADVLDRALVRELREQFTIGALSLDCVPANGVTEIRRNLKRVHLEQAVAELPATERLIFLMHDVEGYDHTRISGTIGLSAEESRRGLHQSRLKVRELLATMV
jgi:DNA-directed RNA polymerase specialized sigma24 family protein